MKRTFDIDALNKEISRANTIALHLRKAMQCLSFAEGYREVSSIQEAAAEKVRLLERVLEAIEEFPDLFTEVEEPIEEDFDDAYDHIYDVLAELDEDEEV